jgi:kinesin family protein 18/19
MKGTGKDPGIIPLLLGDLFRLAQSKDWNWHMFVRMNYMEIYNENINDLFDRKGVNLDIRENEPVGLTEHKVNSFEEAMSRL